MKLLIALGLVLLCCGCRKTEVPPAGALGGAIQGAEAGKSK